MPSKQQVSTTQVHCTTHVIRSITGSAQKPQIDRRHNFKLHGAFPAGPASSPGCTAPQMTRCAQKRRCCPLSPWRAARRSVYRVALHRLHEAVDGSGLQGRADGGGIRRWTTQVALAFGGGLKRCPYRGRVGVERDWGAGVIEKSIEDEGWRAAACKLPPPLSATIRFRSDDCDQRLHSFHR
jgi:hypothetical protein